MISFVEFIHRDILLEGGKALEGVVRMNQKNAAATIQKTIDDVSSLFGISTKDLKVLGSAGKKDPEKNGDQEGSSGDIDLGVSVEAVKNAHQELEDYDAIFTFMKDRLEDSFEKVRNLKGLKVISVGYPIVSADEAQQDCLVQLDIMPVASLDFSEWAYYSPSFKDSKWKGLYRNELLYAIAKFADLKVKKSTKVNDEDVPTEWDRFFFDLNGGLMQGTQTKIGKKAVNKSMKTVSKNLVSNDPKKICEFFFGPGVSPADALTFEQVYALIMSEKFPYKANRDKILAMAAKGIKEVKKHELPDELKQYYKG